MARSIMGVIINNRKPGQVRLQESASRQLVAIVEMISRLMLSTRPHSLQLSAGSQALGKGSSR
jgi:hypothetical protein